MPTKVMSKKKVKILTNDPVFFAWSVVRMYVTRSRVKCKQNPFELDPKDETPNVVCSKIFDE